MKNINDIYNSIVSKFKSKTNLEVANGSVIDSYIVATSAAIEDTYKEIENNKNPHIFTKLTGSDIDSMGMLVGCARRPSESDDNYKYRMLNWNTSNQASNSTSIESALQNMEFASNVTYVPFTQGVGTGTAYIIPKILDSENMANAIQETKNRLEFVMSKSSYIEYVVPKMLSVEILVYLSVIKDEKNVKLNIEKKMQEYINSIAPGEYLEIGVLNKIGINEPNVNYFSVSTAILNDKEINDIRVVQKLEEKFLFDKITWNMVVNE